MPEQQQQLAALLEIENTATTITNWSPLLVPGLLQTGAYARAIMIGAEVPHDQIDMRVAVRVGRRETITRKNPVRLVAVVYEPVLSQLIGGPDVMTDQLSALLEYGGRHNVELRVIPTRCGWHPGLEGPFSMYEFDGRDAIVHIENRISGLFLHEPNEVEKYGSAAKKVVDLAMSPEETAELIANVINDEETTKRDDTGQLHNLAEVKL
jgi:hypothetical protein